MVLLRELKYSSRFLKKMRSKRLPSFLKKRVCLQNAVQKGKRLRCSAKVAATAVAAIAAVAAVDAAQQLAGRFAQLDVKVSPKTTIVSNQPKLHKRIKKILERTGTKVKAQLAGGKFASTFAINLL